MDVAELKKIAADQGSLFDGLTDDELAQCADKFEGDYSYRFFVVLDGQVEVLRDFETLATLGPGECFGEMGVATDGQRNARVVASERSHVASMIGWDFREMCDKIPTLGDRIEAIIDARTEPTRPAD